MSEIFQINRVMQSDAGTTGAGFIIGSMLPTLSCDNNSFRLLYDCQHQIICIQACIIFLCFYTFTLGLTKVRILFM